MYVDAYNDDRCDEGYANSAVKRDIDFKAIEQEAFDRAATYFDKVWKAIAKGLSAGLSIPKSWKTVRSEFTRVEDAREAYRSQPMLKELDREAGIMLGCPVEEFFLDQENPREKYLEHRRCTALSTFAVVKDGKWYERGEMGWFGMVSDEKLTYDWETQFMQLLEDTSDDTILTVVDCHI